MFKKQKENPQDVLFSFTNEQNKEKERRNNLLSELGDNLSVAQILYSKPDELEKMKQNSFVKKEKITDFNLKSENQNFMDKKEKYDNNFILKGAINNLSKNEEEKVQKEIKKQDFEKEVNKWENRIKFTNYPISNKLRLFGGRDGAGMLNISGGGNDSEYLKDAVGLENVYDEKLASYSNKSIARHQPYIENKIKEQFKDFNFDPKDIKGNIFKKDSAPVKRIQGNKEFKDIISTQKEKILSGENFSGEFLNDSKTKNLKNAFKKVDFLNNGFDENGDLQLYMFDTYDFNKGENPQVEAGRRLMQEGKLKGHFSLHEIKIPKKDLDEIFKK